MVWDKHQRARLSYLPPGPVARGVQERNQPLLGRDNKGSSALRRGLGFSCSKKGTREDEENSEHLLMEDPEV